MNDIWELRIDRAAISVPSNIVVTQRRTLTRSMAGIQLTRDSKGGITLGAIQQLEAGSEVGVCGPGYNDSTLKVPTESGAFFFAFKEDLYALPL